MKFRKNRKKQENPELSLTPMIDVVFQLLIFFLVAMRVEDVLGRVDVSRPAPDPTPVVDVPDLLQITVYNTARFPGQGISLNRSQISFNTLERHFTRLSSIDKGVSIIIKCTGDSRHETLVKVLDLCAKYQLKSISVFSM